QTPGVVDMLTEALKHQSLHEKPNPYDTHPPLAERLAALGVGRAKAPRVEGPPSLSLLDDVPALEAALVAVMAGGRTHGALACSEVGHKVSLPMWEGYARELRKELAGVTPSSLPTLEWERIGRRIGKGKGDPTEAAEFGVGVGLALVLAKAGFTVET